jgi:hypothetical protein
MYRFKRKDGSIVWGAHGFRSKTRAKQALKYFNMGRTSKVRLIKV